MSLERTIKDTLLAESVDLDMRLQQLVRAGLMPSNTIPLLRKGIAKIQGGYPLQGAERDIMANFLNTMMFMVLGDDAIFNKARVGAKSYATEAKDESEYGYEGDMAISQLKSISRHAEHFMGMLKPDTDLPEWVQSKITLAADYISTAHDYMMSEVNEAQMDGVAPGSMEGDKHMCATKVFHKEWNEGTPIKTMHAKPDTNGLIDWYDVMFEHGIERVMTEDMEVLRAESHMHSGKKMKEQMAMPFEKPYKKVGERKDKYGNTVKNVPQYLAKKAMNAQKNEEAEPVEEKRGLWDNIHAKRKRIKSGSGERMRKPGSEGAPSAADLKSARNEEMQMSRKVVANTNDPESMKKYTADVVKRARKARETLTKESRRVEALADIAAITQMNESYKTTFDAALTQYGIKSPSELDEEKRKQFFNFVDQNYKKGDN